MTVPFRTSLLAAVALGALLAVPLTASDARAQSGGVKGGVEAIPGKPSRVAEPPAAAPEPAPVPPQVMAPEPPPSRAAAPVAPSPVAPPQVALPQVALPQVAPPQVALPEFRTVPSPVRPEGPPAPAPQAERAPAPDLAPPAQAAAPVTAQPGDEAPAGFVDPPARVGRIARLAGPVETRLAGGDAFEPARQNLTVTSGSAFATGPGGRVALEVGPSRFGLEAGSRLEVTALDDETMAAGLEAGTLAAILRPEQAPPRVQIGTSRATVEFAVPGRYVVEAGGPGLPTRVTIFDGAARVTGQGVDVQLGRGQAAILSGGEGTPVTASRAGAPPPILAWTDPVVPGARPLPPSARAMTGATELAVVGAWGQSPDYGDVWYPPDVGPDWVPYRQGTWVPVGAWGETWVDDRPWAYATSHYGRWVRIGPRWAWAPQPLYRLPPPRIPVWAPALVGFVGPGPGPRFGRPAGWVPLAPFEPYYPPFRASPRYVERVNVVHVRDAAGVRDNWNGVVSRPVRDFQGRDFAPEGPAVERGGIGFRGAALAAAAAGGGVAAYAAARYANAGAGTAIPEAGLRARQPVAPLARPLPPALVSVPPGARDGRATFGAGPDGIRGTADDRLRAGRAGPDGVRGTADDPARAGRSGPDGTPGTPDDRARVGRAGPDGIPGTADDRARVGRFGPDGLPGTPDDRSRLGRAGPDGIPGTADDRARAGTPNGAPNGTPNGARLGRVGPDGIPGTADDRARAGRTGPDGIPGTADDRGRAGRAGPDGIPGTADDRARAGRFGPDGLPGTADDRVRVPTPDGARVGRAGPDGIRGTPDDLGRGRAPGGGRTGPDGIPGTPDDLGRGRRSGVEPAPFGSKPGADPRAFAGPNPVVPRAEVRPPPGFAGAAPGFEPRRVAPPAYAAPPVGAPAPRFAPPAYAAPVPRPEPRPVPAPAFEAPPRPVAPPVAPPPVFARPAGPPPGFAERPRPAPPPVMAAPPPRPAPPPMAAAPPPRPAPSPPPAAAAPRPQAPPQQAERRRPQQG